MSRAVDIAYALVPIIIGLTIYYLPTFLARGKQNFIFIALLNTFFGLTGVGWIAALVWAMIGPAAESFDLNRPSSFTNLLEARKLTSDRFPTGPN